MALKDDGTVVACRSGASGQLGDGTYASSRTPVKVSDLTGVKDISGGYSHSLALKDDGTAWAWGNNSYGQLGNGTEMSSNKAVKVGDGTRTDRSTPVQVANHHGAPDILGGVETIAAGGQHSLAIGNLDIDRGGGNPSP